MLRLCVHLTGLTNRDLRSIVDWVEAQPCVSDLQTGPMEDHADLLGEKDETPLAIDFNEDDVRKYQEGKFTQTVVSLAVTHPVRTATRARRIQHLALFIGYFRQQVHAKQGGFRFINWTDSDGTVMNVHP